MKSSLCSSLFLRKMRMSTGEHFFAFLEKFGFWFRFDGEDNNKGILNIERAEMLKLAVKKDTVSELEIAPFMKSLFVDRTKQQEEITRIKK